VRIGSGGTTRRRVATLLRVGATGDMTDGQLLERFAARDGEAAELAFAELVERHGGMVSQVCRSVLRDDHEARDAFQATFLVLVNKAGSLWVVDSLAPWLHSVAHRVALRARSNLARRRRHERGRASEAAPIYQAGSPGEGAELGSALHEELGRLPERYRVPIVLCDLEGRSHEQAARHLGWPVGTVKSRQARGRDRLRDRLARRGFAPASFALATSPAARAEAARASAPLIPPTAVMATASGASGMIPGRVARLTQEVLMTLTLGKLKSASILLAVALAAASTFALAGRASGVPPGPARAVIGSKLVRALAFAPPEGPGKIYLGGTRLRGGLVAIDPTTGAVNDLFDLCGVRSRVSPDRMRVAYEWQGAIYTRDLIIGGEPRKVFDLEGAAFGTPPVWSADGTRLICSLGRRDEKANAWRFKTVRFNADGTGLEVLNIPVEDGVHDWSADGWVVTQSSREAKIGWQIYVMKTDGSESKRITEGGNPWPVRFSPDGRRVLYSDGTSDERRGIWVVDRDGGNRRKILAFPKEVSHTGCWSPDGKKIAVYAFIRQQASAKNPRLIIAEVDGPERTEFPLEDIGTVDMPDWR